MKFQISPLVFYHRDVSRYLRLLLRKEGHNFHSSSELEIVRNLKEVSPYVLSFHSDDNENNDSNDQQECSQNCLTVINITEEGTLARSRLKEFRAPHCDVVK